MRRIIIAILILLALVAPRLVFAVMTSTNYSIIFDAVGVAGGDYITSTTYSLSETIGETPVLTASSTSYKVEGGYQAAVFGSLSFTLDTNTINLGTLSTSAVNSSAVIATVSNDSSGYILSINNVVGSMPAAVTGGAVVAGIEGYGFSASGIHSSIIGDVPVAGGTVIASTSAPASNAITTLTFKAAASATSTPGTYSQIIDLVAAAN